jgi:large subunit ribosomal protein L32
VPVPKHRHSKARSRSRAAHFKVATPTLVPCPRCKKPKPAHTACPHCGRYRDREVVQVGRDEE